jgi:hypothetical protein
LYYRILSRIFNTLNKFQNPCQYRDVTCQVYFMDRENCNTIVTMRLMRSLCKNYILSSKGRYWLVRHFTSCNERLGGGEVDVEQRAFFFRPYLIKRNFCPTLTKCRGYVIPYNRCVS